MGDVTENYPQGYISASVSGQPKNTIVPTLNDIISEKVASLKADGYSEVSTNVYSKTENGKTITVRINDTTGEITTTTTTEGSTSTAPTSEAQQIQKQINKLNKALDTASPGAERIILKRLGELEEAKRNLEATGQATYTIRTEGTTSVMTSGFDPINTVITPSGFQSRQSSLQTPEQKTQMAEFTSRLQTTSEGVKYTPPVTNVYTNLPTVQEGGTIQSTPKESMTIGQVLREANPLNNVRNPIIESGIQIPNPFPSEARKVLYDIGQQEAGIIKGGIIGVGEMGIGLVQSIGRTAGAYVYEVMPGKYAGGLETEYTQKEFAMVTPKGLTDVKQFKAPKSETRGTTDIIIPSPKGLTDVTQFTPSRVRAYGETSEISSPIDTRNLYLYPENMITITGTKESSIKKPEASAGDVLTTGVTALTLGGGLVSELAIVGVSGFGLVTEAPKLFTAKTPEEAGKAGALTALSLYGLKSGLPKYRETIIPQETGQPVIIKSVGYEVGKQSFIIGATRESEGFQLTAFKKAPDVQDALTNLKITGDKGEGIRISNPTETKVIQTSLERLPPESFISESRGKEFIPKAQSVLQELKGVESAYIKDFEGKGTEALTPEQVKVVLTIAKEEGGLVSGSYSRSAQLSPNYNYGGEEFALTKVPKDIDIHLDKKSAEEIGLIAQRTTLKLQEMGLDVKLKGEGGVVQNAILVKQPSGEYIKAVEFLGEGTIPVEEIPPDMVLGFKKGGKSIKINDVKVTSLGEELRGVTQGVARLRRFEDGKLDIYPREGRVKDIGSISVSARTLAQSQAKMFEGAGNINLPYGSILKSSIESGNKGTIKKIEELEGLYPPELVKSQVEKVIKEPDRIVLADYSRVTPTMSTSIRPSYSLQSNIRPSNIRESPITSPSNRSSSPITSPSFRSVSPSTSNISPSKISPSSSPSITTSPSIMFSPSNTPSITTSPSISPSITISPSPSIIPPSTTPRSPPSITPPISPPRSEPPKKPGEFKLSTNKSSKRFKLLIRQRGKFRPVDVGTDVGELSIKGQDVLRQTARASYKIVNEGGTTEQLDMPRGFIKSKKEFGVIVQPRESRISSQGEKLEISYAGQRAKKNKFSKLRF